MFFLKTFSEELSMAPETLGPNLRAKIKAQLKRNVEGAALGRIGYVVHVAEIADEDISKGHVDDTTGEVTYKVTFKAIVFRPFRNEVLDTVVTTAVNYGFWAKAGPLQIFVSRHMMPEDLKDNFDHDNSTWVSDDKEVEIRAGCGVRLRLMAVKFDQNAISAVGTIADDYLGLVSAEE